MAPITTTTIELPNDLRAQAQDPARTADRPLAWVLTGAVAQGLAYERRFSTRVEVGRRSIEDATANLREATELNLEEVPLPLSGLPPVTTFGVASA